MAGAAAKVSGWYRAYQGFVAAAAKVNQLISFGCGVWLVMSTPLTLISASLTLKFTEAAMILMLGCYGVLLLGVEVPLGAVQTMLRQYFFFVYTRPGRAGFVFNIALMCWQCQNVRRCVPSPPAPVVSCPAPCLTMACARSSGRSAS